MEDEYTLEMLQHTDEELERTSRLLQHVFPHARHLTPEYLSWLYRDNPDGRAFAMNAYHRGELVGHCGGATLKARVNGEVVRGMLLLNAAVHPSHVRHRITRRTTDPMFELAAQQGFSFALAIGNARSTLPLLTRFELVRPLDARLGVGRPVRGARTSEPSFERVWSDEALRWRLACPTREYAVRTVDGRSIVTASAAKGIDAILYDGDDTLADSGPAPAGPLKVWLGLDPAVRWGRSSFLPIPMRLRPSPLNLMFKDLTGRGVQVDPARVVFRGLDFDAY